MSDTPRTDALECDQPGWFRGGKAYHDMLNHARELEREIERLTRENARLQQRGDLAVATSGGHTEHLTREQIEDLRAKILRSLPIPGMGTWDKPNVAPAVNALCDAALREAELQTKLDAYSASARSSDPDELRAAVTRALRSYRFLHQKEGHGNASELVDVITPPEDTDIKRGLEEIDALADHITSELVLALGNASSHTQERDEPNADVERYAFLREQAARSFSTGGWYLDIELHGETLDAAIDAALAKAPGQKE